MNFRLNGFLAMVLVLAGMSSYAAADDVDKKPWYKMSGSPNSWRYGNYGGKDWTNKPYAHVDALDKLFKSHDAAWEKADAYWKPKYASAKLKVLKDVIYAAWVVERKLADTALSLGIKALPVLILLPKGNDTWGGKYVGADWLFRVAFATAAKIGAIWFPLPQTN